MTTQQEYPPDEKFLARKRSFINSLSQIEQRYIEFFKGRKNYADLNDHDTLSNYYSIIYNGHGLSFHLDPELPKKIQDDCMECYKEFWGTATEQ